VPGFNALQIILASGFGGITELGHIPTSVVELAWLPEAVSLVRASEHINFHLAAKSADPVRRDTSTYQWIVESAPSVVKTPDYFLAGTPDNTFQLIKKLSAHPSYPALQFLRFPIKFVPSTRSRTKQPELWLSTVIFHDEDSVAEYLAKGVRINA
jgi:hypothetical protein